MGGRVALALVAILSAPALCARAAAQDAPLKTVLTITAGTENFPSNPIIDGGVRNALAARADLPIDYFTEYLESDFFPAEEASLAFRNYIRDKYRARKIDLVIAMTDPVLRFVLDHRAELFPDAPIVFVGLGVPDEGTRTAGAGLTGVKVGIAYAETLHLALTLQPSTREVLVVARGRPETEAAVRPELQDFSGRVRLSYVVEKTVPELLARVRTAPPESVILYIWHTQQDPGHVMYADAVARLVTEAASVPVYGTSDFYIGSGVVGGVVRDTRDTGTRLGQIALQVLTGTHARDIPIETARIAPILDWRQLRRWRINEARVPAGARVLFREPGVWDQYKGYILAAVAVLLAQSGLISGLLVQARRRRRAEARIRDLGSRLLGAQEAERSRIARELHDDVSQQTAILGIDLQLLIDSDPGEPEARIELARNALQRTRSIAQTIHALSHRLHPAKLQLMGLVPSLKSLQREFSKTGVEVAFTHRDVPGRLPFDLTLCLFRIVQEALQNAVKHGSSQNVSIDLAGTGKGLTLTIADDGVGFDVDAVSSKGLGLTSMRERLEPLGGTLKIQSRPGSGTRLHVFVPAPPPAPEASTP
jgi:signal transduction histidine kinase